MDKIKAKLFPICLFTILFVLFILGTFYDLQISQKLSILKNGEYYSNNFLLMMTEILGETVIYGFVSFACFMIYNSNAEMLSKKEKTQKVFKICSVLIAFLINVFATYKLFSNILDHFYFEISSDMLLVACYILGGVIFTGIWYLICANINEEICKSLSIWSLIILLTALISQILVHGAKPIFGRIRYRTLCFIEDFSLYTKWFEINKLTNEQKEMVVGLIGNDSLVSFPSGHSACSALYIVLVILGDFLNKFSSKKWKIVLYSIAICYSIIIPLSRIIIGAHFLTDVTISLIITFASFYFSKSLIYKKFKDEINFIKN